MFDFNNNIKPLLTNDMKKDIKSLAMKIRLSVNNGNDEDAIMEEVYQALECSVMGINIK